MDPAEMSTLRKDIDDLGIINICIDGAVADCEKIKAAQNAVDAIKQCKLDFNKIALLMKEASRNAK